MFCPRSKTYTPGFGSVTETACHVLRDANRLVGLRDQLCARRSDATSAADHRRVVEPDQSQPRHLAARVVGLAVQNV